MTPDLLAPHTSESYKGWIHMGGFAFAAICLAYNAGAALTRRDGRLTAQAVGYAGLALWEAKQIRGHWGGR